MEIVWWRSLRDHQSWSADFSFSLIGLEKSIIRRVRRCCGLKSALRVSLAQFDHYGRFQTWDLKFESMSVGDAYECDVAVLLQTRRQPDRKIENSE
jgi:hypothetical protein